MMNYRIFSLSAIALALLVVSSPAYGAQEAVRWTHLGKVVSFSGNQLVMANSKGEEHAHTLTADAKCTLDGRVCTAADLKPGTRIRVTTQNADQNVADRIEGIAQNSDFANSRRDGKLVSITGNQLVMTSEQGREHSHTLTANAKLTLDGKACEAFDLRPGTRIRVTTEGADQIVANRIEGIDRNLNFAGNHYDGKVVSITDNQLVMTNAQGNADRACNLTADVQVTCDGEACKSSDLRPGMRIRVTAESDDPNTAARIEALDRNLTFASR